MAYTEVKKGNGKLLRERERERKFDEILYEIASISHQPDQVCKWKMVLEVVYESHAASV